MKTKTDILLDWCKQKGLFSSVDIQHYKNSAYHLGADRVVRSFAERGLIKRLTQEEIIARGLYQKGRARIGYWEAINE